jgi:hypothetical protein
MNHASFPGCIGKELCRTLGEPDTGIRDDQTDSGKAALLEVLEERAPARLVLLGAFADAENLTPIATSSETLRTSPAQLRLSTMPSS